MVALNDLDRFHLCEDAIDRLPKLGAKAAYFKHSLQEKLIDYHQHIREHGDDMPNINGWQWGRQATNTAPQTSTEGDNV